MNYVPKEYQWILSVFNKKQIKYKIALNERNTWAIQVIRRRGQIIFETWIDFSYRSASLCLRNNTNSPDMASIIIELQYFDIATAVAMIISPSVFLQYLLEENFYDHIPKDMQYEVQEFFIRIDFNSLYKFPKDILHDHFAQKYNELLELSDIGL